MMDKITVTEDFNKSYEELKSSLKEKYLNMLNSFLEEAKDITLEKTHRFTTDEIFKIVDETKELRRIVEEQTNDFYKSDEYTSVQLKLKDLNERLTVCEESEKEDLQKQISKAMAEVVTKNITIKNRLKPHNEKIKYNEELLTSMLGEIGADIEKIREEAMSFLREKVAICIKCYNDELRELNDSFKIPNTDETEVPFDSKGLKIDFPILELTRRKTTVVSQKSEDNRTIIASENDDLIKN